MRLTALALALAAAGSASAAVHLPADGVWQFPAVNGSGLTLDVRGETVGIGLYTYDDAGKATWYSGAGALVDGVVDTTLARWSRSADGTPVQVGESRPLRIEFATPTRASVEFGGGDALAANHFAFGADYVTPTLFDDGHSHMVAIPDLRGRWLFATGDGAAHDVTFTQHANTAAEASFQSDAVTRPGSDGQFVYSLECVPDAPQPTCQLYLRPAGNVPPAPPIAAFNAGDLSATRIASTVAGANDHAFRVPTSRNAPATGIWQIVGENGQGITIDVRPDLVAVGVYGYTDAGDATWSLATGALDGDVLEADLSTFSGAGCVGCVPPGTPPPVTIDNVRPLRLEFVTPTRALLTIDGAEPVALTLLPFGAAYLDKPIAGDPQRDTFGGYAMPSLLGHWVRTDVRENDEDEVERYPAVMLDFTDEEDASLDGGEISHVLAWTDAYDSPTGEDRQEATLVLCGDESQEPTNTTCEMQVADGAIELPLPDIDRIATFAPWDASATRIALTGEVDAEPVYLFRVPAVPATPTAD